MFRWDNLVIDGGLVVSLICVHDRGSLLDICGLEPSLSSCASLILGSGEVIIVKILQLYFIVCF